MHLSEEEEISRRVLCGSFWVQEILGQVLGALGKVWGHVDVHHDQLAANASRLLRSGLRGIKHNCFF